MPPQPPYAPTPYGPPGQPMHPPAAYAPAPQGPQQKPFHKRPWVWGVAAALVVVIGAANAGDKNDASSEAASTATASPSVESSAAPSPPTQEAPTPVAPAPPTTVAPSTTSAAPAGVDFTMPDVVGVDLQSAQNAVQSYGVFFSRSHDLLGSRNQVVDSNWIVCTQNIPAGQRVTGDAEGLIDFGVVKREESCP